MNHSIVEELEVGHWFEFEAYDPSSLPSWLPTDVWVRLVEACLLHDYKLDHLELPPLNSRSEGSVVFRPLADLADCIVRKARLGLERCGEVSGDDELVHVPSMIENALSGT